MSAPPDIVIWSGEKLDRVSEEEAMPLNPKELVSHNRQQAMTSVDLESDIAQAPVIRPTSWRPSFSMPKMPNLQLRRMRTSASPERDETDDTEECVVVHSPKDSDSDVRKSTMV